MELKLRLIQKTGPNLPANHFPLAFLYFVKGLKKKKNEGLNFPKINQLKCDTENVMVWNHEKREGNPLSSTWLHD